MPDKQTKDFQADELERVKAQSLVGTGEGKKLPDMPECNYPEGAEDLQGLLDLSAIERTSVIVVNEKRTTHIFERITVEDWQKYLKDHDSSVIEEGGAWSQKSHLAIASINLWNRRKA